MHISNESYFADRQRHDLALRMIRHEARTCTIRACTGLTDDRIRRLYQAAATNLPAVAIRRHRGKSPRQVAFFTRNTQMQFESSLLASVFVSFGLLEASAANSHTSLARGTLFCDAYETHLQLSRSDGISFEHAWFLLQQLTRKAGFSVVRCRRCDGQFLQDTSSVLRRACPACTLVAKHLRALQPRRRNRSKQQPCTKTEMHTRRGAGAAATLGA